MFKKILLEKKSKVLHKSTKYIKMGQDTCHQPQVVLRKCNQRVNQNQAMLLNLIKL